MTKEPLQAYEELAIVEATGAQFTRLDDLLQILRRKAREVGANALIVRGRQHRTRESGDFVDLILNDAKNEDSYAAPFLWGVAIRLESPSKRTNLSLPKSAGEVSASRQQEITGMLGDARLGEKGRRLLNLLEQGTINKQEYDSIRLALTNEEHERIEQDEDW